MRWYGEFAKLSRNLTRDIDYEVDEKKRTISVLEPGITKVEDHLGIENLYESANTPLISFLNNSIKAKELFHNDKEYVVMDGEVLIVDEHTGRMLAGRRYNDGLHQAIEAKEGVEVREEYQTLATVTLQNYFRLYEKLSGMTGTAMTEASEFDKIYKLGVVPIPTNLPMVRDDQADLVYRTEEAKYDAVVDDIAERTREGSADAGRHRVGGEVRAPVEEAAGEGRPAHGAERQGPRRRGEDRRARRSQGCGHGRHQHGRSRHRHHARRVGGVHRRRGAPQEGARADRRDRGGVRSRLARHGRADQGAGRRRARRGQGRSAACTSSAPSGTSHAASTTSCAVDPADRATRASRGSTSRSRTS